MKRRGILALVLVVWIGMFPANAESAVPGVPVKGEQSPEYQAVYLASFCAANIVHGDIRENIAAMRAVCGQISVPTAETISYVFQGSNIRLAVEISFNGLAFVEFFSETVPWESMIPLLEKACTPVPGAGPQMEFVIDGKGWYIASEDFIGLFDGTAAEKVLLRFPSPYDFPDESALEDIEIVVMDAGGRASAPVQDSPSYFYDEDAGAFCIIDLEALDSLPESLDSVINGSN